MVVVEPSENTLALSTRDKVYLTIGENPGLHFRELVRRTGLAVGALQYHVGVLERKHLIKAVKDGKFVRYYSAREEQPAEDERTISLLRQASIRRIVLFLLTKKRANNLAIAKAISLSPSTASLHLKKMLLAGFIDKKRRGRKTIFFLKEPEKTAQLIVTHKKSFLDELVDNFVEVWENLEPPTAPQ